MNYAVLVAFISLVVAVPATTTLNPQLVATLWQKASAEFPSAVPAPAKSVIPSPSSSATAVGRVPGVDNDGSRAGSEPDRDDRSPAPHASASPGPPHHDHHHKPHHGKPSQPQPVARATPKPLGSPSPSRSPGAAPANGGGNPIALASTPPKSTPAPLISAAAPGPRVSNNPVVIAPPTTLAQLDAGAGYPVYSFNFTAPNNPFHETVAQLVAQGATLLPANYAANFLAQGLGPVNGGDPLVEGLPIYTGTSADPTYTISCTYYSARGCNAQGMTIHVPSHVVIQPKFDGHLSIVDQVSKGEFDGWQCSPPTGGQLKCYWGGWYPFSGKGLTNTGNSGIHGGYAVGLGTVTAQEVMQGHIDHALYMTTGCLNGPTIYPAEQATGSDELCNKPLGNGRVVPNPQPGYGTLVHLKLTHDQIMAGGYSFGCQVILTALNVHGAYTSDTGAWGLSLMAESDATYTGPNNPWKDMATLEVFGAGNGSGPSTTWDPCLRKLTANDLELYAVPNLGY